MKETTALATTRSALAVPAPRNPIEAALAALGYGGGDGAGGGKFNICTPVTMIDRVPPMHRISIRVVTIDAAVDTYKVSSKKVGLGKNALNKIASAGGVSWEPERCGQVDTWKDPHRVKYRAVGRVKDFDGRERVIFGEKEVDLRGEPSWAEDELGKDTREFLRQGAAPRDPMRFEIPPGAKPSACRDCGGAIFWVPNPFKPDKTRPADADGNDHWATCSAKAEKSADGEAAGWPRVYQARQHISSLAETKAKLRAIREALFVPTALSTDQIAKPWVVPAMVPDLDTSDPEIRRMMAASLIGSSSALYGPPRRPAGALAPALDEPDPVDVSDFVEDVPAAVPAADEPDSWLSDEPERSPALLPLSEQELALVPVGDGLRMKYLDRINGLYTRVEQKLGAEQAEELVLALAGSIPKPLRTAPLEDLTKLGAALAGAAGGAR